MAQIRATTRPSTARGRGPWRCWACLALLVVFWLIPEDEVPTALSSLPLSTTTGDVIQDNEPVDPEIALDNPEKYVYPRKCPSQQHATLASIQQCYPEASLHLNDKCTNHDISSQQPLSWSFLQECISGRSTTKSTTINQIHVIGERNSGTKWLQQELAQCFSTSGIRCHRDFLRSKHFFQPPVRGDMSHSLVIAIVRSPEEWVAAMREKPYHMPHHMKGFDVADQKSPVIPLEWNEFMDRSLWTMPQQSTIDQGIIQRGEQNSVIHNCVQSFGFTEVSPCLFNDTSVLPRSKWRGHMPIYELQRDHSGTPFEDILKLRADKILNFFLEVPLVMQLGGFVAVRYEDLVREGTRPFLERIATLVGKTDLPLSCKPQPPRPERLGRRAVPPDVQQWIDQRLVLETEQLLAYR